MIAMLITPKFLENKKAEAGFTLLEVIIAMAIMALAFGAILAVEGSSINASIRAKQMNIIAMLAKNQMVETEFRIRNKPFDEIPKEENGKFDPPYETYRWKTTIREIKFPQLSQGKQGGDNNSNANSTSSGATNDTSNSDMANQVTKLTSNFLSKALREVTVSVIWKQGSKDQNFSLSTYWVDLNHEFNLTP